MPLIAAIGFGWYWFTELRWLESTDDAYTQADNTIISPKIAGYVSELLVTDNQLVKAGELLLRIDPRDYRAAVNQAEADGGRPKPTSAMSTRRSHCSNR
jgi:membrane fusion protein (multidrug efflux system)